MWGNYSCKQIAQNLLNIVTNLDKSYKTVKNRYYSKLQKHPL